MTDTDKERAITQGMRRLQRVLKDITESTTMLCRTILADMFDAGEESYCADIIRLVDHFHIGEWSPSHGVAQELSDLFQFNPANITEEQVCRLLAAEYRHARQHAYAELAPIMVSPDEYACVITQAAAELRTETGLDPSKPLNALEHYALTERITLILRQRASGTNETEAGTEHE